MSGAIETDFGWEWSGLSRLASWRFDVSKDRGVGQWGEWLALRHVQRLGWDVVSRNWTCRQGEVDLIAYDERQLVFIEVKTRTFADWLAPPETAITDEKLDQIERLAFRFLNQYELADTPFRIDMIGVETRDFRKFALRHSIG